jgi:hypothetical protein
VVQFDFEGVLFRSDSRHNDRVNSLLECDTKNYLSRFHICIKKGITTPLPFLLFCFKMENNLDDKFRNLLQK